MIITARSSVCRDNTNNGYMDPQNSKYYVGSLPIDISVNVDDVRKRVMDNEYK